MRERAYYEDEVDIICGYCFRKLCADTQGKTAGKQRNEKGLKGNRRVLVCWDQSLQDTN